jgi:hypothetical protein
MLSPPIEQVTSQIQSECLVALESQPIPTGILRKHVHHQTTSGISFRSALVDDVDSLKASGCGSRVDVEQSTCKELFGLCKRSALQRLVFGAHAQDVQMCQSGVLFPVELFRSKDFKLHVSCMHMYMRQRTHCMSLHLISCSQSHSRLLGFGLV